MRRESLEIPYVRDARPVKPDRRRALRCPPYFTATSSAKRHTSLRNRSYDRVDIRTDAKVMIKLQ
jgi:hypothetical protein